MSINKLKGVIFDFDGTILDSMGVWRNVGYIYLESKNRVPEKDLYDKVKNLALFDSAKYIKEKYNIDDDAQKIEKDIYKIIEDAYFYTLDFKEGCHDFLNLLKSKNIKMCIATATDRYLIEKAIERLGVSSYFDFIITCKEAGKGKQFPDIYNKASELLGCTKDEVIVFEDAFHAAKTAKDAGYTVCGIYDETEPLKEELQKISDYYINSYKEAGDLID